MPILDVDYIGSLVTPSDPFPQLQKVFDQSVRPAQVPPHGRESGSHHNDGVIPKRGVKHAECATKEYKHSSQLVGDGSPGEVDSGQRDDTNGRPVESRKKSVYRCWKGIPNMRNAHR